MRVGSACAAASRADVFTYDVLDNCAAQTVAHPSTTNPPIDQSCLTQQDMGRPREPEPADVDRRARRSCRAPRCSSARSQDFTLSASYGQGIRSIDPSYITQDVKTPFASIEAYEGGRRVRRAASRDAIDRRALDLLRDHVDKDLIFSETAGRNVLGVGTTRTGWVGALRVDGRLLRRVREPDARQARRTTTRTCSSRTSPTSSCAPTRRSSTTCRVRVARTSRSRASLSAGITYVGPRPLPYGELSEDIFTIDASRDARVVALRARASSATNLLDTQYRLGEYNYASDFHSQPQPTLVPERTFTAGAPRGIFATFAINFGGA